jgi:hypothetical protein
LTDRVDPPLATHLADAVATAIGTTVEIGVAEKMLASALATDVFDHYRSASASGLSAATPRSIAVTLLAWHRAAPRGEPVKALLDSALAGLRPRVLDRIGPEIHRLGDGRSDAWWVRCRETHAPRQVFRKFLGRLLGRGP